MEERITLAEVCWILELEPLSVYKAGERGLFEVTTTKKNARVVDAEAVRQIHALAEEGVFEARPTAVRHPDAFDSTFWDKA